MEAMKIVALEAENIKRLTAVQIRPDGNLVEITGKNGAGKSSILDAIWWALAGTSHIQARPIRDGAEEARITLDLGEVVVTRRFKGKEDGKYTTSITVENADGARYPSPQTMLDELLGALAFDPLAFARMKPKEQFDTLKGFVGNFDFEQHRQDHEADFAKRTEVNRTAKEYRAQAEGVEVPEDTPDEPVDEQALYDELENVGSHNAEIERQRQAREQAENAKTAYLETATKHREEAERLRQRAAELEAQADADEAEANRIADDLAKAESLPEPKDAGEIRERLNQVKATNEAIARKKRKAELVEQAKKAEAESRALTQAMEERERKKQEAIAAAKLPVEGVGFADNEILLNNVPFDQASDAEQLRASVQIAMAMNPRLRVLRIRDGSLLDEDSMKLLARMADEHDFQCWVERVDSSGNVGFVIEDGHVRGQQLEAAE